MFARWSRWRAIGARSAWTAVARWSVSIKRRWTVVRPEAAVARWTFASWWTVEGRAMLSALLAGAPAFSRLAIPLAADAIAELAEQLPAFVDSQNGFLVEPFELDFELCAGFIEQRLARVVIEFFAGEELL